MVSEETIDNDLFLNAGNVPVTVDQVFTVSAGMVHICPITGAIKKTVIPAALYCFCDTLDSMLFALGNVNRICSHKGRTALTITRNVRAGMAAPTRPDLKGVLNT